MFDYINPGFYLLSGIVVFICLIAIGLGVVSKDKEETIPKGLIFVLIFAIVVPILFSINTKADIDTNTNSFNSGRILKCTTLSNQYLVSQENGWEVFEDSFTKESLLIRADKCTSVK